MNLKYLIPALALLPLAFLFFVSKKKDFFFLSLIVFCIPVATLFFPPGTGWGSTLFDGLLFCLFIFWLLNPKYPHLRPFEKHDPFLYPVLVLLSAFIISTIFASSKVLCFIGFLSMFRLFLLYKIVTDMVNDFSQIITLCFVFVLSYSVVCLMGLLQGAFGVNFSLYKFLPSSVSESSWYIRTIGTFSNPLNFGNYLSVGMFLAAFLLLCSRNIVSKVYLVVSTMLGFVTTVFTLSRGPIIYAAISFSLLLTIYWKKKTVASVILCLVILITTLPESMLSIVPGKFLPAGLVTRFLRYNSFEGTKRYKLWSSVFEAAPYNLIGVGLRNNDYKIIWPPYVFKHSHYLKDETRGWKPFNFHFENVYIAFYMNLGLLGFIGIIYTVIILLYENLIGIKTFNSSVVRKFSICLFVAAVSMALNMITNPGIISDIRLMMLFVILLGLTSINKRLRTKVRQETIVRGKMVASVVVSLGLPHKKHRQKFKP